MNNATRLDPTLLVVPANAGTQRLGDRHWIPAFAGMTKPFDWQDP